MHFMKAIVVCFFCVVLNVESIRYDNVTYIPSDRQLSDFRRDHPLPLRLWTKTSGEPTEIRDTLSINSDQFNNQLLLDTMLSFDAERKPERLVYAKGTGAFGYFEVTNDISKYTSADLFNGIGKKTPLVTRFSTITQQLGGTELGRELKGMAIKFYTKEGNFDLVGVHVPVYLHRDPILFSSMVHAFKRNPQTGLLYDLTSRWDIVTQRPILANTFFWILADFGIPDGYRKMDAFPIHTYEISNKNGERHYVRFNFRTENGISTLTGAQASTIAGQDPDYFSRDLFNAIEQGNYPTWRLEMDVMTPHDLQKVDYNPFDVTRIWKNGTFFTEQIGRLVLNRNVENHFRDVEQAAFNPANLVPGIPGPVDFLFKGRRMFYRDAQNYRLGRNHNKVLVNMPLYAKTYNRDGRPPTTHNERDAPNYYPNSFNGPIPYVDEKRPKEKLLVLESNAIDLEPLSYFYNSILENEAHRQRFVTNIVRSLPRVTPPVQQNVIKLMSLIDHDLGRRVEVGLIAILAQRAAEQANAQATSRLNIPVRNVPSAEIAPKSKEIKNMHGIN